MASEESSDAEALLKRWQDACILVMETFSTFQCRIR
ncbi:hypothetical protein T11_17506 [Trichinella zimbabwensis]|uniref:Uncharacterized protein n=1 Tax=Trichinella zimbabwensis TaxID=268475 RepID=A0A0V1GMS5_9BILA|nr:hypothetical protein T11_16945 [Trichinella zimbabwensis]KRY99205.1 hypothetical protein T11_7596 [Trichinella zimbabwensis]KRY99396.1 hypothetical protein T11_17506 [Trichinella zimbabwensis]